MISKSEKIYSYDVPGSKSSGARFYSELTNNINYKHNSSFIDGEVVLFNIYTPFSRLLYSRFLGKKVVLRVDGLWHDRLSGPFLDNTNLFSKYINLDFPDPEGPAITTFN